MIGIFDSGVGGLSIYQNVKALLPHQKVVYLADSANFPYGSKTARKVRSLALNCLLRLARRKPALLIVACNTASVSGLDYYRQRIPQIPIIGVVPVVKTAAEKTKNGCIAILATPRTSASFYQKKLIRQFCSGKKVLSLACPNLVSFVEKGDLGSKKLLSHLAKILEPAMKNHCDVLVLGCTHYPFLRPAIRQVYNLKKLPLPEILDSGEAVAKQAKRILEKINDPLVHEGKDEFLATGNQRNLKKQEKKLIKIKILH